MIIIERLNAHIQVDDLSHAIVSSRPQNTNPMLLINQVGGNFIWSFTGLQIGEIERISGQPRQNHFDFYIGMDDLVANRGFFPPTTAVSLGLTANGLRIPVNQVRPGGKQISWRGPLARLAFENLQFQLPPYKVSANRTGKLLNIDKEFSRYPINNGNGRTTRELHFGFENPLIIRPNNSVKIPRISVTLTPEQYATVLEAVDLSIRLHV